MSMLYGESDKGPDVSYEYEGFSPGSEMAQIRDMDPEGWHNPTVADFSTFPQRVIDRFGRKALESYQHYHDPEMGQL
jgi:hypothetical protein